MSEDHNMDAAAWKKAAEDAKAEIRAWESAYDDQVEQKEAAEANVALLTEHIEALMTGRCDGYEFDLAALNEMTIDQLRLHVLMAEAEIIRLREYETEENARSLFDRKYPATHPTLASVSVRVHEIEERSEWNVDGSIMEARCSCGEVIYGEGPSILQQNIEAHLAQPLESWEPTTAAEMRETVESGRLAELERLKIALEFYADPETYFGVSMVMDSHCGEFADDFGEVDGAEEPGKRARAALAGVDAVPSMELNTKDLRVLNDLLERFIMEQEGIGIGVNLSIAGLSTKLRAMLGMEPWGERRDGEAE